MTGLEGTSTPTVLTFMNIRTKIKCRWARPNEREGVRIVEICQIDMGNIYRYIYGFRRKLYSDRVFGPDTTLIGPDILGLYLWLSWSTFWQTSSLFTILSLAKFGYYNFSSSLLASGSEWTCHLFYPNLGFIRSILWDPNLPFFHSWWSLQISLSLPGSELLTTFVRHVYFKLNIFYYVVINKCK